MFDESMGVNTKVRELLPSFSALRNSFLDDAVAVAIVATVVDVVEASAASAAAIVTVIAIKNVATSFRFINILKK